MAVKPKTGEVTEAVEPGAQARSQDGLVDSLREEEIRRRAYEVYLERGEEHGHEIEDWLQAERELTTGDSKAAGQ